MYSRDNVKLLAVCKKIEESFYEDLTLIECNFDQVFLYK